jgi:hypothetical protein
MRQGTNFLNYISQEKSNLFDRKVKLLFNFSCDSNETMRQVIDFINY